MIKSFIVFFFHYILKQFLYSQFFKCYFLNFFTYKVFEVSRKITENIALFVPKTTIINQVSYMGKWLMFLF